MNISENSWHYWLYKLGVSFWCKFTGNHEWEYTGYANLCTYIRVITVYLPIMIGLHMIVYLSPIWVPFWVYSIYPTSHVGGWIALGFIALAILVFVSLVIAVGLLIEVVIPGAIKKIAEAQESRREKALLLEATQEQEASAWQILTQWLRDRHEKICRKINFS